MAKENRPNRGGSKVIQDASRSKAEADSRPTGEGSDRRGVYINERGLICYGNECVTLAIDPERKEVVVNVKPSAVCNIDPLVEALRKTLGAGSRTVYEVESDYKEK